MLNIVLPTDADLTLFAPELAVSNFTVRLNDDIGLIVHDLSDVDATLAAAARADELKNLLITISLGQKVGGTWYKSEAVIRKILQGVTRHARLQSIRINVVLDDNGNTRDDSVLSH